MTTIYLIRHSKVFKVNNELSSDNLQVQNEKISLSIEGELLAQNKMSNTIFNNIDKLYSSNYVRAIQTAKYLADKNNLEVNVVSDLGERKFGVSSFNELPDDFGRRQFLDENYKIGDGESQKEVRNRMVSTVTKILDENKGRNIAIVSHGTAISYLLKKWCNIEFIDDKLRYYFNDKVLLHGHIDNCMIFKLEFDDNNEIFNIEMLKDK